MRFEPESNEVIVDAQIPDKSWLGLTLGQEQMAESDMLVFEANGN
jgi:hypothetical protein